MPASHVQHDDVQVPATLKQIQQLWKKDPFFERLMARLQGVAEATFGEGAAPQNMQFFSNVVAADADLRALFHARDAGERGDALGRARSG